MAAPIVVSIVDTSSIIAVKELPREQRKPAFDGMSKLVAEGRLVYPPEVLHELKRYVKNPDPPYAWANKNAAAAHVNGTCSLDDAKAVLAEVPDVLDPEKDSGEDEADPYVLAVARNLQEGGTKVRVVTEDRKDTPKKMSMDTAAGILGVPSVPLKAFLKTEKILS